ATGPFSPHKAEKSPNGGFWTQYSSPSTCRRTECHGAADLVTPDSRRWTASGKQRQAVEEMVPTPGLGDRWGDGRQGSGPETTLSQLRAVVECSRTERTNAKPHTIRGTTKAPEGSQQYVALFMGDVSVT